MSTPSKGKQISVVVAGATGSTGSELVSRLVSHPDISRVVALTRHPIPVNRWTTVFPHLHTGDALRYLSVVPVDWQKVLADTSNIPSSYLVDGIWRPKDVRASQERYRKRMAKYQPHYSGNYSAGLSGSLLLDRAAAASGRLLGPVTGYIQYSPGSHRRIVEEAAHAQGGDAAMTVNSAAGVASSGSNENNSNGGGAKERSRSSSSISSAPTMDEVRESQLFLQKMLQNTFYRSIFSGHHVAINCIGTSHMLSSAHLAVIDYDLSIAFAKVVRLFNCMAHAEPTEDEERILVESTSRELDSVLWDEIYTACYGKRGNTSGKRTASATAAETSNSEGIMCRTDKATLSTPSSDFLYLSRGNVATLRHFAQVSVRSASDRSPIPYLRAHGRRDRDLLWLFNRAKKGTNESGMHFSANGSADLDVFVSTPVLISSSRSTGGAAARSSSSSTVPSAWWWRGIKRILWGNTTVEGDGSSSTTTTTKAADAQSQEDTSPESIARKRAELLLRRDVVKIWENANITIWRPGVLARPHRRFLETLFSLVERPIDVGCLAECIVDDIVESLYRESADRFDTLGVVKVINGKSVSRRVNMKTIEDHLDAKDIRHVK